VSVIAAHPADLQARYLLAQAQREQGDLDGAEATGRALRELAPNDSRGPVVLSQVYADRRQHAKVIEVLTPLVRQPAEERATTSSGALGLTLRLAGAHLALGQYDAAIEVLDAARTERSEVVVDTYLLQTLVAARRFERALVVGEQVRAARPADPMPARLVAQALQGVGRTEEALAILTAQRDSRPDDPMALIALASVLSAASRHEEAVAAIEQGAARFGNDTAYWFQRGAVHERAGEAASAEEAFRRALALDPEHAPTLNYLGYMYAERGERLPEAVRLVQQALAIDPDNGSYLDSLGWAYFRQGRLNEARRYLQRAAELLPDNSVIQDHYGDVLRALGDRRGAIAAWERAISGDGESVKVSKKHAKGEADDEAGGKVKKAPKVKAVHVVDDEAGEAFGKKHGKHLLGHHGEAMDGEATFKVKAPKVHKVKVPKAPKVKAPKVVYVDEAGEAGGKKHGKHMLGHHGEALDGEAVGKAKKEVKHAGEAVAKAPKAPKAPKVKGEADGEAVHKVKKGKMHGEA
jgi:tetratricopeptide (TPR) repeat protein